MLTFGELFLFSSIEKLIPGYIEIIALAMHVVFAEACTIIVLCDL